MSRFFTGLFIASGAVVLAVGVLKGVEKLLSNSTGPRRVTERPPEPVPEATIAAPAPRKFSIKRTNSEMGFVYWILQGYGPYKCYLLCDTWAEAMEQAKLKVAEVEQPAEMVLAAV